jgi:hypothetical protein
MNTIINKAKFPIKKNIKIERQDMKKSYKDLNLIHNKYKDNHILNNNKIFKNFYEEIATKNISLSNIEIFKLLSNLIKHKILGGIRLEVKGRLTKRYRADRAIYKLK